MIAKLPKSNESSVDINAAIQTFYDAMNDDFNSPVLIAELFETVKLIHRVNHGEEKLTAKDIDTLHKSIDGFVYDVLGLTLDASLNEDNALLDKALDVLIELRNEARASKDFTTSDRIRDSLFKKGIQLKDGKDGTGYILMS
jgi:cysteinyl-tRNA synthetase